jgi:Helix-turn-helix domain
MLPPLFARPPTDPAEERRIRRLAAARHAPASWLQRARIVTLSWDGAQVGQIAAELGCHPRTVYRWLHRFNQGGIDSLGDLPRAGRPRRLGAGARTGHRPGWQRPARSAPPPARRQPGGRRCAAAGPVDPGCPGRGRQAEGIAVSRSQVRRILQAEGVRWRTVRSWSGSGDPDFAPKGRRSSPATPPRRLG